MEQPDHSSSSTTPTVRIAVIGSGPAGMYTCEALLNWADRSHHHIVVDCIDRLPVPFGLLRHGVAPDHPRIKGIARVLRAILDNERVRFFGNVDFGRDLTIEDARRLYHAVVVCTGALDDRAMGIPGERLNGVFGAAEFVTWYDGHPDASPDFALNAERAAVIGVGNVALDVARMLLRPVAELAATDIPEHVRRGFGENHARVVSLVGRRSAAHAKFTPLELRELDTVGGLRIVVNPKDLDLNGKGRALAEADRRVAQVLACLERWKDAQLQAGFTNPDDAETAALEAGERVLRFRFNYAPKEIIGSDGLVSALRLENTSPTPEGGVRGTGDFTEIPVGAVYSAVGYRSTEIDGIPFDSATATIPNSSGRVRDSPDGKNVVGLYTAGWIKRGPSGVIGTNKSCAAETVGALTEDFEAGLLSSPADPAPSAVQDLLSERGIDVIDDAGWAAIDRSEIELGARSDRDRTKLAGRADMMRAALPVGADPCR